MKFEQALAMLRNKQSVHTPEDSFYYYFMLENQLVACSKKTGMCEIWNPSAYDIMTREYELYEPPWDGVVPPEPRLVKPASWIEVIEYARLGWETAKRERALRLNTSSSNEA